DLSGSRPASATGLHYCQQKNTTEGDTDEPTYPVLHLNLPRSEFSLVSHVRFSGIVRSVWHPIRRACPSFAPRNVFSQFVRYKHDRPPHLQVKLIGTKRAHPNRL